MYRVFYRTANAYAQEASPIYPRACCSYLQQSHQPSLFRSGNGISMDKLCSNPLHLAGGAPLHVKPKFVVKSALT